MTVGFDIQVAHTVDDIGQQQWDCLTGNRRFASYRWYRFAETVMTNDQPVYIVLLQEKRPVASSTFWLKRQETLPITSPLASSLLQRFIRRWPLLICRSPLASTNGLILPPKPWRDAALATMAAAACDIGRQHRASFVLYDYVEGGDLGLAGWPSTYSSVKIPNPGTLLDVNRPDFASYLAELSGSARKDYRRHRNRAADQGITVTANGHITAIDEALNLIRNVEHHHGTPPNPYARGVLEHAHLVDHIWLTAHINKRLVGCGLLLRDNDALLLALLGLDYQERYVYFQLVYAAIRQAIESDCRVLRGGGGAYETKKRLGFQLENQNHIMLSTHNPILRQIIRWVPTG